MVEVIKRNAYKYEYTCQNCGSVMRLDKSDIKYRSGGYNETWWEFTCPVCNKAETDDESLDHFISDKFKAIPNLPMIYELEKKYHLLIEEEV